ncbi:MAG: cation diffusion facilitator family transporter [Clostridia bacterium]|nr:cation diffusion facilitator family transporter [Clostridia bacterium]
MNRYKETKKASILGIIANTFLLTIKLIIGIMTNSQAMIADTVNSGGDIFSSLMTFIGNKIASKPRDNDHNMGHGKAEYIFSMLISISMILVAIKSFSNSVNALIHKEYFRFSWMLVVVCCITILTKFCLFLYTRMISKRHDNLLIRANSNDHRNDCLVTACTLISTLLSLANIYWFDGIVGIGISIWICYTGIKIFIESYNVLMDKAFSEASKQEVLDIVKKHSEIEGVQDFSSTPVGYKYRISFTILVDGNLSTFESHDIANNLESEIEENIEEIYLVVIHVHPV